MGLSSGTWSYLKMKKAIVFLLSLCLIITVISVDAGAATKNSDVVIFINGESFAPPASMVIKNGTTYVPLRAFCEAIDSSSITTWNRETKTAIVSTENLEIRATIDQKYLVANERYLYIPDGCFCMEGNTMVPVRLLAKAFGAKVEWDGNTKTVKITSGGPVIEHGEIYYNQDDVFWLSRIIYAESGAESLDGQIGVGNVVLNRTSSAEYPDTVYDVIFDTQFGTQFTPVSNGVIYRTPTEQCEIAAKLVLDGAETVKDSLFFVNASLATSSWIMENCEYVTTIGGHSFYA